MLGNNSLYLDTAYLNGGSPTYVSAPSDAKKDDILILWDGSKAGTIYHGVDGALGSTLKAYSPKYSSSYLYHFLKSNQKKIYFSFRTPNIPHVVKDFSAKFMVTIPSTKEQKEIGILLNKLDNLITLLQRKLDNLEIWRVGLLQRKVIKPAIFHTKSNWKKYRCNEILKVRNLKTTPLPQYPLASFTSQAGVTPKTKRYNREFLVKDKQKKYKVTKKNDIVYNPANLKFGAIALNKFGNAVISPIYETLESKNVNPEFLSLVLTSSDFVNLALKFQEGTVYERMAVKVNDLLSLTIYLPSLTEQLALKKQFNALDTQIKLLKDKLKSFNQFKQFLLQNMFI